MAIKPMDMQVMMPRVNEVSRVQTDAQQRGLANEQNKVQNAAKDSENQLTQVQSREQAQKAMIRDKQKQQKKDGNQQKKDQKTGEKENEQPTANEKSTSRRTIDIRL